MLDRADDRGRTLDTLVAAFVADPIERWLWPDDDEFAEHFAEFAECFAANARKVRAVVTTPLLGVRGTTTSGVTG